MVRGEPRPVLRAAVLGRPIAHSLSPVLHRAGYVAIGLTTWEYTAHEVDVAGFSRYVGGLDSSWRGLSVTMPLKESALRFATSADDVARRAGAANTLLRRDDGAWHATNTDVLGVERALRPRLTDPPRRALVLGSGATARSAVLALAGLGVRTLTVRARDPGKAADLLTWALDLDAGIRSGSVAPLGPWLTASDDVVVSAVPRSAGTALADTVPPRHAGVLLDVVYQGWPTPLAQAATAAGMTVVGGLDLLVQQAAEQFRLFTGHQAPVGAMLVAGREALMSS